MRVTATHCCLGFRRWTELGKNVGECPEDAAIQLLRHVLNIGVIRLRRVLHLDILVFVLMSIALAIGGLEKLPL